MILAIDTGNTHTVMAVVDETTDSVVKEFRMPTYRSETEYGYAVFIKGIFEICDIQYSELQGVIISSVVPYATQKLKQAIKLLMGVEPMVIGEGVRTDLDIKLDGGIAPDLEVGAVAVKELYPLPCALVDMGTATTIVVVDKDGSYLGGVIYPGAGISMKALVESTSLLPEVAFEKPSKAIATTTEDAMKSGIIYGEAGSVDGIIDRFEEELGMPFASVVMTGGIGKLVAPFCRRETIVDDDLLCKGLSIIYKKN